MKVAILPVFYEIHCVMNPFRTFLAFRVFRGQMRNIHYYV